MSLYQIHSQKKPAPPYKGHYAKWRKDLAVDGFPIMNLVAALLNNTLMFSDI